MIFSARAGLLSSWPLCQAEVRRLISRWSLWAIEPDQAPYVQSARASHTEPCASGHRKQIANNGNDGAVPSLKKKRKNPNIFL
jgi:hypothetical protein